MPSATDNPMQLRRCIMRSLYDSFREVPYASVELSFLQESCGAVAKEMNWNLVYLEKKGFIELDKSPDCQPFISCSASISAAGIDLMEDPSAFEQCFPERSTR